jgi:hypothetical protein
VGTYAVSVQALRLVEWYGIVDVSVQREVLDVMIVQGYVVQETVVVGMVYLRTRC